MRAMEMKRFVRRAVAGMMAMAVGAGVWAQYTPGYTPPQPPQPPTMQPQQQGAGYSWDPGAGVQPAPQQQVQYPPQQQPSYPQQPQYAQPQIGQPQYGQQDPQSYGQQGYGQPVGQEVVQTPQMSDRQLADLTASIALYPDPLLAIMMPAGTYIEELAYADKWLEQHAGADEYAIQQLNLQPTTKALMHYPTVLKLMTDHLDWAQGIGVAFQYQRDDLMRMVQVWRVRAVMAGTLGSTREQVVLAQGNTILILPRREQRAIYVPVYDPAVVYVRPERPRGNYITFAGSGMSLKWLDNDMDWRDREVRVPVRESDYGRHGWEEPRVSPDAVVVEENRRPALDLNFVIGGGKERRDPWDNGESRTTRQDQVQPGRQQAPPPQQGRPQPQPARGQPVAQQPPQPQPPVSPPAQPQAVQGAPGKFVPPPVSDSKVMAPPPPEKKVFVRDTMKPGLVNPKTIVTPDKKVVETPATQPKPKPQPKP